MDAKIKHLEFVQAVINRLSGIAFAIKGWTIALVSGLIALGANLEDTSLFLLALFPALSFCGLDIYFLAQEKKYRKLYNRVRLASPDKIDFDLDARDVGPEREFYFAAFCSPPLIMFHFSMLIAIFLTSCALEV